MLGFGSIGAAAARLDDFALEADLLVAEQLFAGGGRLTPPSGIGGPR
jgi:hypothetical protein